MSKNLIKVNSDADIIEAQKNLEEPFIILVKDGNKLIYQDDSHCDAVILVDDWNNYHTELPVVQRDISWIKGRRCLVKKTADGVAICYLDENNSELFHDGTTVAKLDGSMGQWMTDLPEFNIQCTEGESDWVKLHISRDQEIGHKSRRVLVGVTKGVIKDGKLWSRKYLLGSTADVRYSNDYLHTFTDAAIQIGTGFGTMDYEARCKIAYMFMAKYKNKNVESVELFNSDFSSQPIVGTSSNFGNRDGITNRTITLFGLENYINTYFEYVGDITISDNRINELTYTVNSETGRRSIIIPYGNVSVYGYISRMKWGEYADLIPIEASGHSKYFYSDFAGIHNSDVGNSNIHLVSGNLFELRQDTKTANNTITSRLQYRGKIEVIDDPQEFINLPVGF